MKTKGIKIKEAWDMGYSRGVTNTLKEVKTYWDKHTGVETYAMLKAKIKEVETS